MTNSIGPPMTESELVATIERLNQEANDAYARVGQLQEQLVALQAQPGSEHATAILAAMKGASWRLTEVSANGRIELFWQERKDDPRDLANAVLTAAAEQGNHAHIPLPGYNAHINVNDGVVDIQFKGGDVGQSASPNVIKFLDDTHGELSIDWFQQGWDAKRSAVAMIEIALVTLKKDCRRLFSEDP